MNEPTLNVVAFTGLRNRQDDRKISPGALVEAQNVDIDDTQGIILRPGFQKVLSTGKITASYTTQDETRLYLIEDGDLKVSGQPGQFTTLYSGLSDDYVYWLEIADSIYLSTGQVVSRDGQVTQWRIPTPVVPAVQVVTGQLPAGQYRVVLTHANVIGVEGGATAPVIVDVVEGSGLQVTIANHSSLTTQLYVTDTNGTVYYRVPEIATGVHFIESTVVFSEPIEQSLLLCSQAPQAAAILGLYESQLAVCQTLDERSYVWFSQPFWYNLFDLHKDYIAVEGQVNALLGTPQGLVIATERCFYLYGNDQTLVQLADYGVPRGKPYAVADDGVVYFWTNQGVVRLFPFENVTQEKVSLEPGAVVDVTLIEQNGFRRLLVLVDEMGRSDNARIRQVLPLRGQINYP